LRLFFANFAIRAFDFLAREELLTAEVAKEQPQRTQRKANHQKRTTGLFLALSAGFFATSAVQGFAVFRATVLGATN